MVQWVNRSLVQAPRNGTTTHTVAFTPASAGNLLVAVVEGAVTSSTPTGWTLPAGGSAVNNTGLYVWYKTATAGESSFTTTHNGSNYPVGFLVYEFAAGSTFVKAVAGTGLSASAANPALTGLTGTNLLYGAAAVDNGGVGTNVSAVWSGTGAPVEDLDVSVLPSGTDGYWLGVAYVESSTAASFQPTAAVSNSTTTKEALTFAVNVATTTPVTTATGTAGVSVGLTGAAAVLAVAAGSLALGLALTGTAVPVAVATGTLPVVAALTGAASSAATATGALPASVALTGTASQTGTYTATGALPAALSLTGTASMVATVTGSLPLTAGLSGTGSVAGSYVVTGNLPLTVALTGAAQTVTTVTGALPLAVGLTGSASIPAVPALTGTLPAALSLTGAANIVALTTGTLSLSVGLSGVGVNPSTEHDVTVTAALDPRPWASTLTTRANTGLLVQRSWEARLE